METSTPKMNVFGVQANVTVTAIETAQSLLGPIVPLDRQDGVATMVVARTIAAFHRSQLRTSQRAPCSRVEEV